MREIVNEVSRRGQEVGERAWIYIREKDSSGSVETEDETEDLNSQ